MAIRVADLEEFPKVRIKPILGSLLQLSYAELSQPDFGVVDLNNFTFDRDRRTEKREPDEFALVIGDVRSQGLFLGHFGLGRLRGINFRIHRI